MKYCVIDQIIGDHLHIGRFTVVSVHESFNSALTHLAKKQSIVGASNEIRVGDKVNKSGGYYE